MSTVAGTDVRLSDDGASCRSDSPGPAAAHSPGQAGSKKVSDSATSVDPGLERHLLNYLSDVVLPLPVDSSTICHALSQVSLSGCMYAVFVGVQFFFNVLQYNISPLSQKMHGTISPKAADCVRAVDRWCVGLNHHCVWSFSDVWAFSDFRYFSFFFFFHLQAWSFCANERC